MGKLFFVRHGESEFNAGINFDFNSELTIKGLKQADRAALILNNEIADKSKCLGYVSPYIRCVQTAMAINSLTGINFKASELLGESPQQIHSNADCIIYNLEYLGFNIDWNEFPFSYDYSEDFEKYNDRIDKFLKLLEKDKDYVIVSHMTPITDMIRKICLECEKKDFIITNCSVSLIEDGKPVYLAMT